MALDAPWICECVCAVRVRVRATLHILSSFMGINAKLQQTRIRFRHRHRPPFCLRPPSFAAPFALHFCTFAVQMKSTRKKRNNNGRSPCSQAATVNCYFKLVGNKNIMQILGAISIADAHKNFRHFMRYATPLVQVYGN